MKIIMTNKELAKKAQTILNELGHDVPLGHVYELFSKLTGFQSWNEAKARESLLSQVLMDTDREEKR